MRAGITRNFGMMRIPVLMLCLCLRLISCLRGPPTAPSRSCRQVVAEGKTARLVCPIRGSPMPLVTWTRAGEGIGWSWTRFRQNRRSLKIKKTVKEDTGPYVCKGTNGFGTAEASVHLIVINPEDFPGMTEADLPLLAPPHLTSATLEKHEALEVKVGEEVRLRCAARGFPAPLYSWYKDGEVVREAGDEVRIERAGVQHAGLWACRATNMVGSVGRSFRVRVEEEVVEEGGWQEVVVVEGEEAVLQCRVGGAEEPRVRWLRKLGLRRRAGAEEVISVGREQYQLLEQHLTVRPLGTSLWMSTLTIPNVSHHHAGAYICFVDGGGRFHFSSTMLRVAPPGREVGQEGEVPLVVVALALTLGLALALTAAISCRIHRRNKLSSIQGSGGQVQENHYERVQEKVQEDWAVQEKVQEHWLVQERVQEMLEVQLNVTREVEGEEDGEEGEGEGQYVSWSYSPHHSHEKFNRSLQSHR